MDNLDRLHDALDRVGEGPGRPVSAHLDPALTEAAKAAVAMGLADSVSALTGDALYLELRRLALGAALEEHYERYPEDRPSVAEVAHRMAVVRKLPIADRPNLLTLLEDMADALGQNVHPEDLLTATIGHLAISGKPAA
ncbi:MAG: hypothetical protein ACRDRH_01020 [Pseudonocardia sp.]